MLRYPGGHYHAMRHAEEEICQILGNIGQTAGSNESFCLHLLVTPETDAADRTSLLFPLADMYKEQ